MQVLGVHRGGRSCTAGGGGGPSFAKVASSHLQLSDFLFQLNHVVFSSLFCHVLLLLDQLSQVSLPFLLEGHQSSEKPKNVSYLFL